MATQYYKYETTLNVIERFMTASGIRDFCTNVCKGWCCQDCYGKEYACHRNEGRRMTCSAFICIDITKIIFDKSDKHDLDREYRRFRDCIICAVREAKRGYGLGHDDYFYSGEVAKIVVKEFRIERAVVTGFKKLMLAEALPTIKRRMKATKDMIAFIDTNRKRAK